MFLHVSVILFRGGVRARGGVCVWGACMPGRGGGVKSGACMARSVHAQGVLWQEGGGHA